MQPGGLAFGPTGGWIRPVGAAGDGSASSRRATNRYSAVATSSPPAPPARTAAFDRRGTCTCRRRAGPGPRIRPRRVRGTATVLFRVQPSGTPPRRRAGFLAPTGAPAARNIVANGSRSTRTATVRGRPARGRAWWSAAARAVHCRPDATRPSGRHALPGRTLRPASGARRRGRRRADRDGNVYVDRTSEHGHRRRRARRGEAAGPGRGYAGLRDAGPLRPDEPVVAKGTLVRPRLRPEPQDSSPITAGEAAPLTTVVGTVSCLDQRLDEKGQVRRRMTAEIGRGQASARPSLCDTAPNGVTETAPRDLALSTSTAGAKRARSARSAAGGSRRARRTDDDVVGQLVAAAGRRRSRQRRHDPARESEDGGSRVGRVAFPL